MTVRFASFNVENLFARPRAFNLATWAEGQPILDAYGEFNALIARAVYTPADQTRMIELLVQLDVYRRTNGIVRRNQTRNPRWAWLRANRGDFDVERAATGIEIVADGRSDWTGWLELATEPVDEVTTRMTARVIGDVAADVLAVIEAEDRPSPERFNAELLGGRYGHSMLIDGNDTCGIDVGVTTIAQVEILSMRSNVDEPDPVSAENLFSRDCPEYQLRLPSGAVVWVLVNNLKSQAGGGGPKRARQAQGVRDVVDQLIAAGERAIVVMGDLNEGPAVQGQPPANLTPLFDPNGSLVDVYSLPVFDPGRSRAVDSATVSTTSSFPKTSPARSSAVASNATACGVVRPTSIPPPSGTSTRRSPGRSRPRRGRAAVASRNGCIAFTSANSSPVGGHEPIATEPAPMALGREPAEHHPPPRPELAGRDELRAALGDGAQLASPLVDVAEQPTVDGLQMFQVVAASSRALQVELMLPVGGPLILLHRELLRVGGHDQVVRNPALSSYGSFTRDEWRYET